MDVKILSTILLYFFVVVLIYSYTKMKYVNTTVFAYPLIRFSNFDIILFSLIFTFYNIFCTNLSGGINGLGGDRLNYFVSFVNHRVEMPGLELIFNAARFLHVDFLYVLYATTFICCTITFYGLKKTKNFSLFVLFFLLVTDYFSLTFAQLKQCYTNAFCILFFANILKESSVQRDVACVLYALSASLFHTTGFILFPIFLAMKLIEKKVVSLRFILFLMLLMLLFFKHILIFLVSFSSSFIPVLSAKIIHYFFEEYTGYGSFLTFIKGIPFYFITCYGLMKKNNFEKIIPYYHQYLFLSIIGSCLYLFSIVSYWMFRFTALFYVPIGIFFYLLIRYEKNEVDRYFAILFVLGTSIIVKLRHDIIYYINYGALI
ncbi:EpsG family protein [Fibrobacter sp. UWB13]|uniref:EpsG family protein n=1 Tax=Fibrobacter sp. UWB13 TaxID=1896204 RepID=UPI000A0C0C25|nr:EpsG family protein [Fibrobacter sp. UWB13]SMG16999.1 EpsG family protein [Fibrobacter sp. UWB13]